MIFRSEKKLKLGLLHIGDEGFVGLRKTIGEEHKGSVLVVRETTKEEYLEWLLENEGKITPNSVSNENFYRYYYEVHID